MSGNDEQFVSVAGQRLRITNLDKVMYPQTGTTKSDVMRYYADIADHLLPYAQGRAVTRKRWVDGVDGPVFFQKDLEDSAPDWVPRRVIHHKDHDNDYPVLDSQRGPATLAWFAQVAALELHVPQWRFADDGAPGRPDRMVFDLDPGEGAGLSGCVAVARLVREILDGMELVSVPVTSGSKGIHVYAALDGTRTSEQVNRLAHELARSLAADHPDLVVSTLRRADRRGRVLVDWSQNNAAKTTITPYSLRGRDRPTVAMPRTWREITSGRLRQVEYTEVLGILRRRGDAARPLLGSTPAGDRLAAYRSRRDASRTPEPVPAEPPEAGGGAMTFVIQRHEARRVHYDFRLERDGVLVSWALPKGLPGIGERDHLAVHVEDHPLEYATFAGDIPRGEYGAGHVDIWDHGTYTVEKWRDDEVIATLRGQPDGGLGGDAARVALIRTGRDGDASWLIHRMRVDAPASRASDARREYSPMLAVLGSRQRLPDADADDLAIEMKWDGIRVLGYTEDDTTRLVSRNGVDITAGYPELADLHERVDAHQAVLDGEVVALDAHGHPSFGLLQQRMGLSRASEVAAAMARAPVRFLLFDLLALDGKDLTGLPARERRRLLEATVRASSSVGVPPEFTGTIAEALEHAAGSHLEGIVVKERDAPYLPGRRSTSWTKIKLHRTQEIVVAGWRPGKGSRAGTIGSLLMGIPERGTLRYAGRVGTGFSDDALAELARRLKPLARKTSPLVDVPAADRADAHWVSPTLVGEVQYTERTRDGRLRHPSWRGLRPDKRPDDVRAE